MASEQEARPLSSARDNRDCENHNSDAAARLPDHDTEMDSTPAALKLDPFDDWNCRVGEDDHQAERTGKGSKDRSDSGNLGSDNHEPGIVQSEDYEPDNDAINECEIDYEDLWFDPELFSQVHSYSGNPVTGHYVSVSVNGEPVERWITPLGRDDAGYEIRVGDNVIRLRFRCLDGDNTLRLSTFWDDILKLRLYADPVSEQTSDDTQNLAPENTRTNNNTITTYDTMPGSWTARSFDDIPPQAHGEQHPISVSFIRNYLKRFPVPFELAPLPPDLDLTRRDDWELLCLFVVQVLLEFIWWAVKRFPRAYFGLVLFLIIRSWIFGSEVARERLEQITPILWMKWSLSDEGRAAYNEYVAAYDRVSADCREQLMQVHLQHEARRAAWLG